MITATPLTRHPNPAAPPWQRDAKNIDDILAFHIVFGKSVPDISLNAVANLGYADGRFLKPLLGLETAAGH